MHIELRWPEETPSWAVQLDAKLDRILCNQEKLMATLDDDIAAVAAQSTQIDGVSTLITSLEQKIADALSGTTLPAPVQAKVDALFTALQTNSGKIATAINTGTPAAAVNPAAPGA